MMVELPQYAFGNFFYKKPWTSDANYLYLLQMERIWNLRLKQATDDSLTLRWPEKDKK